MTNHQPPTPNLTPKFPTLLDMHAHRAEHSAELTAFHFQEQPTTYAEMWTAVNRFASHLLLLGLQPGDRVILALPNSPQFFTGFYGVQQAGGIAVPVYPGFSPSRIFNMARLSAARFIVVPAETPPAQLNIFGRQAAEFGLVLITTAQARDVVTISPMPLVQPDDIAFIQYTSGSTGSPKGVQLSHRNLLTNVCQLIAGMEITAEEIFVSWLPVYHDMGLILKTMVPFYLAADLHLLPTTLTDVRPWLETIQKHRATFTAAPDFAYRLLLR
jgi:acyl-CoA synthetase (AMP-forming)/AMP-acid ligase II